VLFQYTIRILHLFTLRVVIFKDHLCDHELVEAISIHSFGAIEYRIMGICYCHAVPKSVAVCLGLLTLGSLANVPPPLPAGLEQTFLDEFDGSLLNTSAWTPSNVEHLNACYDSSSIQVRGGYLAITASHGKTKCTGGGIKNYTSGLINSTGLFSQRFGVF